MFRTLTRLAFVLAALGATSIAQTPDWDRKISDIRIVHPPGTPPGYWRATVDIGIMTTPSAPVPTNLGLDVVLSLNGMPFAGTTFEVGAVAAPIACFPTTTCPDAGCNFWQIVAPGVAVTNGAFCFDPPGSTWGCNCWINGIYPWQVDFVAPPNTTIDVALTSRAGSLPEIYTADDTSSVHISDEVPGTDFCFGDGSGVACPCGNAGAPGNGCASSVNASGAYLATAGTASVSADSVALTASGMPNSSCLYFQGTTQLAGAAFGDGLRCAGGSVVRLGTKTNSAGTSSYPVGTDLSVSVKGGVPAGGGTRTYQAWYRNAAAFCTASTFNLTNGTAIAWVP